MARTAPVPNIPAIPGMNPGVWVMGGGPGGGGGNGRGGRGQGNGQGANGENGGDGAQGGGKNAGACGPGSGGGCPNPAHGGGGGTAAGDPVDPVTGRVYTPAATDLALPGAIPLLIARSYSSETADVDAGLGFGWSHSLAWAIEERQRTLRVLEPHAAPTEAPIPEVGQAAALPCGRLKREREGYTLEVNGLLYVLDERRGNAYLLSHIVDRYGSEIRLAYEGGRLSHVIDSVGRLVRVRRHGDGRIAAFEVKNASAQGQWTSFWRYRYDERGDLVAAVDAAGGEHRYEYDVDHRLLRRREPGGLVAEFVYDDRGRCREAYCHRAGNDALDADVPDLLDDGQTKAKGFLHVKIDDHGDFVEVITSRAKRRIEGNHLDKADAVVFGGGVHSYRYEPAGHVLAYKDPLGATWQCERDGEGRLRAVVDPLGARTEYIFDDRGALVEVIDALGGFARYVRDLRGDVASVHDGLGLVVAFKYDERGRLLEGTLPNGGVTRMEYDALGNRVRVVEPDGATRRIRYDFLGRVTSFVDERGLETTYGYDDCGRLRSARRPSGATAGYDYDADGNLARITDADGRATTLRWGGVGVVTEVVRPDGRSVRYFYDREQDLVRVVNESGEEQRYLRRGEGRIVEERTFDGRRIDYKHDALGRITQIREGARLVEFAYDACGRLVERSFSDGRKDEIAYDLLGRMERVTSGEVTCEYEYDARGRVVRETVREGERRATSIETAYDVLGKAVRAAGPFGALTIARDVAGRPIEVDMGDRGPLRMAYDPAGNLVERILPEGGRITEGVTPDGRPAWVQVTSPQAKPQVGAGEPGWVGQNPLGVTYARSYGWTAAGLLGAVGGEAGGAYTEFPRDGNGQVVARQRIEGAQRTVLEGYAHGPSGELFEVAAPRKYAAGGRLSQRDGVAFGYDERGRVTEKVAADGRRWVFAWGDDDLLRAVTLPDERVVRFAYDPFARRLEKRVERRDRGVESVTRYAWSGDALVHEVRERAAAGGDPVVEERAYAVLPEGILPVAQWEKRGGEGGEVRYWVEAPNGMPEALVDGEGRVVGEVGASLFGNVEGESKGLTPLRFPGQYEDEETGFFYNRHRYYDPETGQYLSPEPIRLGGGLRAYAYVDGSPLELVDADALMKCTITRTGGLEPISRNSGSKAPIHPAVAAALPPTQARDPSLPNPTDQSKCAEPAALSEHLFDWERRNKPKKCYPRNDQDAGWRENLGAALGEIDPNGGIASADDNGPAAPCPNCGQTIPRLYELAGLKPPNNVTAPGRVTGINPPAPPDAPHQRQSPAAGAYRENSANTRMNSARSQAAINQPGIRKDSPKAVNYPDQDLGIWEHDGNGWQRR